MGLSSPKVVPKRRSISVARLASSRLSSQGTMRGSSVQTMEERLQAVRIRHRQHGEGTGRQEVFVCDAAMVASCATVQTMAVWL